MLVLGRIEDVEYHPLLCSELPEVSMQDIRTGEAFRHAVFRLRMRDEIIAISTWVSPKRTRSYPYSRVYDTLKFKSRITIIPLVKDEGVEGDRDYLQWDTVSLMSLLGVYVIVAYYNEAVRSPRYQNKITNQEFDYAYISQKIEEFRDYKSDALHWNLKQLRSLEEIGEKCAKAYYHTMPRELGVQMHGINGFKRKLRSLTKDVETFIKTSREAAKSAQNREFLTTQPKESVLDSKAKITIANYLGGMYYFTVDETTAIAKTLFLTEMKHSSRLMPSINDVKDGLLKMILYTNLVKVRVDGISMMPIPVLGMTARKFDGFVDSVTWESRPYSEQMPSEVERNFASLVKEARRNKFFVFLSSCDDRVSKQLRLFDYIVANVDSPCLQVD